MVNRINYAKNKVEIYLDDTLADWLDARVLDGQDRDMMIRTALYMYMKKVIEIEMKKELDEEVYKMQKKIAEEENGPEQSGYR